MKLLIPATMALFLIGCLGQNPVSLSVGYTAKSGQRFDAGATFILPKKGYAK